MAITCPLQHKYLNDASATAGFACNDYAENIKQKKFQAQVEQEGFLYLPFILETFGGFLIMLVIPFTDYHPMLLPD